MRKKVIVIGGGFAGLQFCRNIDKSIFDVLLIDKFNHHQFQPLFYQVATSQIEPSSISFPLRNIFKGSKGIQIRLAEVTKIEPEEKKVISSIGTFEYDYLVIASGCKTNFFNNKNIEENAFVLKSTYDSINIRNHILTNFEKMYSAKPEEKASLLNLVIVGAGPTGVELAGAFAEIKKEILPKDFPDIDFSGFTVYLIEGARDTLVNMSPLARRASAEYLRKMGVKVITETFVKDYDGKQAVLSNGERIQTATLIWAAGVSGNTIPGFGDDAWTKAGRIPVNRFNQLENFPEVFAIGDISLMHTEKYPNGHPQVANVAINQAKVLAKNLARIEKGKELIKYEYRNMGTMATIGRRKAVVDLPFVRFKGFFAWVVWMFLHLMLILSVRNKVIIFINWAWNYISKDSSLRLILKPQK